MILPMLSVEIDSQPSNRPLLYSGNIVETIEEQIGFIGYTDQNLQTIDQQSGFGNLGIVILCCYILVVTGLLTRLVFKLIRASETPEDATIEKFDGIRLITSTQIIMPFSFFRSIYIPKGHRLDPEALYLILKHEQAHVYQHHSIDLILLEIVKAIFWFNPVYRLIRQEIELIHEYIADQIANNHTPKTTQYANMLLYLATGKNDSAVVNNFSKIQIKERIIMLNQDPTKPIQKVKFLLIIPALLTLFFSFSTVQKTKSAEDIRERQNIMAFNNLFPAFLVYDQEVPVPDGWPIEKQYRRISSGFGYRMHPIEKVEKFHKGIDIPAPIGVPVYAAGDGLVIGVKSQNTGYGNSVKLQHGRQYETMYGQLSEYVVGVGEQVKKGQLIGYVGNSGASTNPHLHFEIYKNRKPIDPEKI